MKRTPLNPGDKPLQRKTPIRSTNGTSKPKAAPRRKPGEAAAEKHAKGLVKERSQGVCEIQLPAVCLGKATNFHHRQNRGRGKVGEWRASNGLYICGSGTTGCHGRITNTNGHRPEYERVGWIVPSWQDPAEVPVLIWPTGLVLLDDEGGFRKLDPEECLAYGFGV